jgi:hypothetical protein
MRCERRSPSIVTHTHTRRKFIWRKGGGAMGKLMSRIQKAAKSPKAQKLEKDMMRKAKDPKTQAKISQGFRKFKAKH